MIALTEPQWAVHAVGRDWDCLANANAGSGTGVFDPSKIGDLPDAARRWLTHAMPAGTLLSPSVQLTMHGRIRIGKWRSFEATQIIKPGTGYIWSATAYLAGLPITGYDRAASSPVMTV